jgi:outer membrane protein OmpA-like peptidoglycan-associated protein
MSETAGISETDLDTAQDSVDQNETLSESDQQANAASRSPARSDPGPMEKFRKLYRVLTMLEQRVVIPFPRNSNEMPPEALETLSEIAEVLIYYPGISIRIVGYTDTSGVESYNKSLSRFRANIVKSYLVGKGVEREQITAVGMGAQNPIGENQTSRGRKINRRVEIALNEDKSFSVPPQPATGPRRE